MSGHYDGPRGDAVPVCGECGNRHLTYWGTQSCAGHVVNDRDSYVKGQPRKPLPEPRPCTRPPGRKPVCQVHGVSGQVTAAAEQRAAEAKAVETARKLIPDLADRTKITNPLETLLDLASEANAFRESLRMLANKVDEIRTTGSGGSEQLRAEVATYRQALKDVTDVLVQIARLDVETMLARIEARKVDLLITALTAGLGDAGLSDEQKRAVMTSVGRHLRSVPRVAG